MGIGEEIKNEAGHALLQRLLLWIEKEARTAGPATLGHLVLWIEKEAHLAGADIEVDVTSIRDKLQRKQKR